MADRDTATAPYIVLARKYRPNNFETLIGQDAMVQTLGNAFKTGRVHHAFIMTGVRGVGKTTTARILARAFNYADEKGAHPTLDLSVEGDNCRAIIEGRHVDVHEMDAASNTGIDDIREIIDSVKYGPVSAPYKVFIIDEVHMLSNSAFNGLLKTLEEPPPYVKFIFATTEIRKVPVTILSRCQRFDLRRVTPEIMTDYLNVLLEKENLTAQADALSMIVRAGEGSVRDCLSLLDQAIAHGGGEVTSENVRAMLGLADRGAILDLFETLMHGDIAKALELNRNLYNAGADAQTILSDLANTTHLITRLKLVPSGADDQSLTPEERTRGGEIAPLLGMRALTRAWQILLKGIEEVGRANNAIQAAEMVLIRLTHAADMPTPDELIEKLKNQPSAPIAGTPNQAPQGRPGGGMPNGAPNGTQSGGGGSPAHARIVSLPQHSDVAQPVVTAEVTPVQSFDPMPRNYGELVELASRKRDLVTKVALECDLRLVSFAEGRIEVELVQNANPAVVTNLSARLKAWTGQAWMVSVSTTENPAPTIRETQLAKEKIQQDQAHDDPLVRSVMETFPGTKIVNIRVREAESFVSDTIDSDIDDDEDDD